MDYKSDRYCVVNDSTNISLVEYSVSDCVMIITFASGGVYQYFDIAPAIFGAIVSADSVGTMFQKLIRSNPSVKFEKLEG